MIDPIVEEVRRWRMEHTRKFGGDLEQIYDDLCRIQHSADYVVVRRRPKLIRKNAEQTVKPGQS